MLVDLRRLLVVEPRVVKHQPDVVDVLPRMLVLARVELTLDGRQVHRRLHDVVVVLRRQQQQRPVSDNTARQQLQSYTPPATTLSSVNIQRPVSVNTARQLQSYTPPTTTLSSENVQGPVSINTARQQLHTANDNTERRQRPASGQRQHRQRQQLHTVNDNTEQQQQRPVSDNTARQQLHTVNDNTLMYRLTSGWYIFNIIPEYRG